ncbi:hypothetical protein WCD74_01300 [Actinomycetospora sp. OC33-EN08]|uniref:Lactonase family protein n=1 Tax=Actinomycetospora aurantiaca TaxID=3129233 RepID=A0ABU8MGB9_9PSEU
MVPVASSSGVRFSADGRYAYVVNQRDGIATVVELDSLAGGGAGAAGVV